MVLVLYIILLAKRPALDKVATHSKSVSALYLIGRSRPLKHTRLKLYFTTKATACPPSRASESLPGRPLGLVRGSVD